MKCLAAPEKPFVLINSRMSGLSLQILLLNLTSPQIDSNKQRVTKSPQTLQNQNYFAHPFLLYVISEQMLVAAPKVLLEGSN